MLRWSEFSRPSLAWMFFSFGVAALVVSSVVSSVSSSVASSTCDLAAFADADLPCEAPLLPLWPLPPPLPLPLPPPLPLPLPPPWLPPLP
ncbi:hypothetical protein CK215_20355 [Mesorhizobium sp. WSM3864]|nr:hypothetical protein CK215_20355 [Mesorhizobium sp. WSM3864]